VGGPADVFVEPGSEADLGEIVRYCAERRLPFLMLGRGSNLLVRDAGFRGVVVSLSRPAFCQIQAQEQRVKCGAGARLNAVANAARRASLAGFEFLEGIPGGVGGALRMNAGAMSASIFDLVVSVRLMDPGGNIRDCSREELQPTYRQCLTLCENIALCAVLEGKPGDPAEIERKMAEHNRRRWQSQPVAPSAGCIFKNPGPIPAGKLIDELGLKGTRVGGARVSLAHANFIVNEGGATAGNMLELIELIRERARSCRGIELEMEVQVVGE